MVFIILDLYIGEKADSHMEGMQRIILDGVKSGETEDKK